MKSLTKRILRIFILILLIVLALLVTLNFPVATFLKHTTTQSYDTWMSETLSNEDRVIDVAMLGAHDAFTSEMDVFSPVDELSADSIQTGAVGLLIKGFSYKQSKTQVSDVTTLLNAGIRYFDIRLTFDLDTNTWWTVHTYFSTPFETVLDDINAFLEEHPGEFLVLDIQHVYSVNPIISSTPLLQIHNLFDDSGVLDYAYPDDIKPLNEITYGDVTNNGTEAGVIILSKFDEVDSSFFLYQSSIRSAWANTDSLDSLYAFLGEEAEKIQNHEALTGNQVSDNTVAIDSLEGFRVMQGVLTMQMSGGGIIEAALRWSLLERAMNVNVSLIEHEDFQVWLEVMPICMVDYANSTKDGFLDNVMEIIINFNEN